MIDTRQIDEWLALYRRAWTTDSPDEIARLFTEDVRYYSAPYREPMHGRGEVIEFWHAQKEAEIPWSFDPEVIARDGGLHVVRAVTRYPEGTFSADGPEVFHNLWLVTLAEDGRAREFVEYFMLEE